MIRKIVLITTVFLCLEQSFAQDVERGRFDWNKVFAGGSIVLGLGFGNNSQLTLGGNPELGYSIFKNVDLGLCGNYVYNSIKYPETKDVNDGMGNTYQQYTGRNIKQTSTLSGLGIFARLHINDGFFIQFQPEFNTISYKVKVVENPDEFLDDKLKSSSFLVGIGYGKHVVGETNFFTTILIDLQKDLYSPYRTYNGEISPIIRSGFNFYFNRKKKK